MAEIQNFRRNSDARFVKAVFYDGTNLSDVVTLGVQIRSENGEVKAQHVAANGTSYWDRLFVNAWVVVNPYGDDLGAVTQHNQAVFRVSYEGPFTDEEVREAAVAQAHPATRLRVTVYGDHHAQIIDRAMAEARGFFGSDAKLEAQVNGRVVSTPNNLPGRGRYTASVDIRLVP